MCCSVRWDMFRHLKSIEFPSDPFMSTDKLETSIETFTNTLRSPKIAGQVHMPREAIKYFPDFSNIVTEKHLVRKQWQCYRRKEDKAELNINTFKYHVFAPMGRFQLESIYLYFPPSSQLLYFSVL